MRKLFNYFQQQSDRLATYAFLALIPEAFLVLSYCVYIIGGNFYYVSYGCLAVTLILVSLSVAAFLCKLVTLAEKHERRRIVAITATYLTSVILPPILLALALRFYLLH